MYHQMPLSESHLSVTQRVVMWTAVIASGVIAWFVANAYYEAKVAATAACASSLGVWIVALTIGRVWRDIFISLVGKTSAKRECAEALHLSQLGRVHSRRTKRAAAPESASLAGGGAGRTAGLGARKRVLGRRPFGRRTSR